MNPKELQKHYADLLKVPPLKLTVWQYIHAAHELEVDPSKEISDDETIKAMAEILSIKMKEIRRTQPHVLKYFEQYTS